MALSQYDVLIVGGGPSGLTTALYLARFRRNVLVVDDGNSRAVKIPRSHNMPGYPEGVMGAELVAAIRKQAAHYGVGFQSGRIVSQRKTEQGFSAELQSGEEIAARELVLATGASDIEPPMPYFMDAVRCGALRYCPVCDGYEVIGQMVGVLTDNAHGIREALYLRNFTHRLKLFFTQPFDLSAEHRLALQEACIEIVEHPVDSIRQWNGDVVLRCGENESRCDSVYSALGMRVHSELAQDADLDDDGYIQTDAHQMTNIEGLYAVGDVSQGLNQISVAIGNGAKAAASIHLALGRAWK